MPTTRRSPSVSGGSSAAIPDLTEKMFGGLAFLIHSNMVIARQRPGRRPWSVSIRGSPLPWSRRLLRE
jgi:hypothetical protein